MLTDHRHAQHMIESIEPSLDVLDGRHDILDLVVATASAVCSGLFPAISHDDFVIWVKEIGRLVVFWDKPEAGSGKDGGKGSFDDV
jgi:hypothetical protein